MPKDKSNSPVKTTKPAATRAASQAIPAKPKEKTPKPTAKPVTKSVPARKSAKPDPSTPEDVTPVVAVPEPIAPPVSTPALTDIPSAPDTRKPRGRKPKEQAPHPPEYTAAVENLRALRQDYLDALKDKDRAALAVPGLTAAKDAVIASQQALAKATEGLRQARAEVTRLKDGNERLQSATKAAHGLRRRILLEMNDLHRFRAAHGIKATEAETAEFSYLPDVN